MTHTNRYYKGYNKLALYWMNWEAIMFSPKYGNLTVKEKKKLIAGNYLRYLR